jgi:hypothetical protein
MRSLGLGLLFAIVLSVSALAQSTVRPCVTTGSGPSGCPPVSTTNPLPVVTTPSGTEPSMLTPGQHNVTIVTATALTIPAGATAANVCAKGTGSANYTLDGTTTPTATVGTALSAGACVPLAGTMVANFLAINSSGSTITLDSEYYK